MLKKICQRIDNYHNPRHILGIFLLIWLLINLLQAYFTELAHDEAYYWMYSRYLDWGYFDHPPMIALLVKIGYSVFQNELGVRLLPLLMGTATLFIIYLLMEENVKSISLFILLVSSILIFKSHIGGFLAIPDLPVVFFAALFFLTYKKYAENDSVKLAVLLGIISAAMLYSKYHGILVLVFTLGSNIKIVKRWSFWLIPFIAGFLFIPHILWQFNNNFPTFEYHLVSRSSAYKFDHTFNYLYSQLLISGPFIGLVLYYYSFRISTTGNRFYRALKFNFIGFVVFFFFSSFKGHVEAHWTAIAYIPALVLSYKSIFNNLKVTKWVRVLFVPTIMVVFFLRICLVIEILPRNVNLGAEFHNWDIWAQQIKAKAGDSKVVFVNSFQRPSKYAFYTGGNFAHTLNSIYYRKNQFDLWHFADSIQGKRVFLITGSNPDDTLNTINGDFPVRHFESFKSYYDIKIIPTKNKITAESGSIVTFNLSIFNSSTDSLIIEQAEGTILPQLTFEIHDGITLLPSVYLQSISDTIPPKSSILKEVDVTVPEKQGKYYCYFSIVNDNLLPSFNSGVIQLTVKN